MLACPYCNSKKGDRPIEEFKRLEQWRIPQPLDMPDSVRAMLAQYYGVTSLGLVSTGSTNAKLKVSGSAVIIMVRAHKTDPWHEVPVGNGLSRGAAGACWDFLKRHNTPGKPAAKRHYRPGKKPIL